MRKNEAEDLKRNEKQEVWRGRRKQQDSSDEWTPTNPRHEPKPNCKLKNEPQQ